MWEFSWLGGTFNHPAFDSAQPKFHNSIRQQQSIFLSLKCERENPNPPSPSSALCSDRWFSLERYNPCRWVFVFGAWGMQLSFRPWTSIYVSWPALRHTQAVSWAFCNIQSLQRMEELYCAEMQQVFPKLFYCTNVRVGLKYCSSTCLSFLIENSRWLLSCVRNVIIQFPLAAFGLSVKHVSNKEQKLQRLRKVPLVFFFPFQAPWKKWFGFQHR